MKTESEKYNKVLNILRKSKPVLSSAEEIEREVIRRISKADKSGFLLSDVIDFLFGWIYISWVRRSLITASFALIMIFIYQQSVILKRINYLSSQTIVTEGEPLFSPFDAVEKRMMMYRMSGRRLPSQNITVSEKQMNQLLESVNELRIQYKDLLELIEENPELKKLVEKKISEKSNIKIKL